MVLGVGPLNVPSIPKLNGIESFTGSVFHSAQWDHSVDLTGKKVAVIGTGASAIQFVPVIADQVGQLQLYQRTPPWVLTRFDPGIPKNIENDDEALAKKRIYPELRKAEARYMPTLLRSTLEETAHWGAVRVIPASIVASVEGH